MRPLLKRSELLEALKECLHDLENVKLRPDDPDIVYHKRLLLEEIAALEKEDSESH